MKNIIYWALFLLINAVFFQGLSLTKRGFLEERTSVTWKTSKEAFAYSPDFPIADLQFSDYLKPGSVDQSLDTPPAVSLRERLQKYPSPGEFVAFSLKVAKNMINRLGTEKNYRTVNPEVYNLGGINKIHGLVYDQKNQDTILIGKYDPQRQPITLDDLVVAIRALFMHGEWPYVSIDPTDNTKSTGLLNVEFMGGIGGTQFGADLLDTDHRLKRMVLGFLPIGVPGLKSPWEIAFQNKTKETTQPSDASIRGRLWITPALPSVTVRQNVVAMKGLKVSVLSEIVSVKMDNRKIKDRSILKSSLFDSFAHAISTHFDDLAQVHPSFSRIQGLGELVAVAEGIRNMEEKPNLDWWLESYTVKRVFTPRQVKWLERKKKYRYSKSRKDSTDTMVMGGGAELLAIAVRIRSGDVTALKEAVLQTRPRQDALTWKFVVGEWVISTSGNYATLEDVARLFTHARILLKQKRYEECIALSEKIIDLKPDWYKGYYIRGLAHHDNGNLDRALSDYTQALKLNPKFANAYYERGIAYHDKKEMRQAISDFSRVLELRPHDFGAYSNRGLVYHEQGDVKRAIAEYTQALKYNPKHATAYSNRGVVYMDQGDLGRAILEFTQALKYNPEYADAYFNRGLVYLKKNDIDHGIADYTKGLKFKPNFAEAYVVRGKAYVAKGDLDHAIADYSQALKYNPTYSEAFFNLGNAYWQKEDIDRAIVNYTQAVKFNPTYSGAFNNLGNAYSQKGDIDRAIVNYTQAVKIEPEFADAYFNRGISYQDQGDIDRAIADFNRVVELNPKIAEAYKFLGLIWLAEKNNMKKGCEYLKLFCRYGECSNNVLAPIKKAC